MGEYETKEKDIQKGVSRIPLDLCRLSEEDLVNLEQFNKKLTDSTDTGSNSGQTNKTCERTESVTGIPMVEMTEELEENIRHRGKAYMTIKNSIMSKTSDEDSDEIANPSHSRKPGERSRSLYCRSSECEMVTLEEFQLVSILGKGSFGKVYLVYLPNNQTYYAMKSIRKDIVLDNDSVENIKLEKLILL